MPMRRASPLNLNHLFDKWYYRTVGSSRNNYYGEPRNVMLTLRGRGAPAGLHPSKPLARFSALLSTGLAVSQLAGYWRMNSLAFSMRALSQAS